MIEYDQRVLPLAQLLNVLEAVEKELPSVCPLMPNLHNKIF